MDLQPLAKLLQESLDPRLNKQAEASIKQAESQANFSLALLQIVASDSFDQTIRLASALYFKNFIRRNYTDEDGNYKLPLNETVAIKRELIGLMISVPPTIQTQLGEAISVIADSDFWERWDTLVDDLVSRLTVDNPTVNNGVLQVAHSIFKRWRPLFQSDALYTEINHVLTKFGEPYVALLQNTDRAITQNQGNEDVLKQWFITLNLIVKLFYDLSCQDLPPVFEDNLGELSQLLHKYLTYDNPKLQTDDEAESGPLEFVKAGIFEALVLYTQKYEDVFDPHRKTFIESSWLLLTNIGPEPKYDILVSKALRFLTAVAKSPELAKTFSNSEILKQVVEKVILPNLTLRESDEEMFEDEPIEFIRRDLEGSDSDTRRRAATDFLRQLLERFETLVTQVVSNYVSHYLGDYAKDPKVNWKSKDTAIYLFSSIAAKGTITSAQGVTTVNPNVDILDFFQKYIAEDLTTGDSQPILKVDAIKYLYIFRSQLSAQNWQQAFPLLVQHLGSANYVVYTYAAIAVERVLSLTGPDRQLFIPRDTVAPLSQDLLRHLFSLIQKDPAPEKIQENEFLMRCVMRVLIVIREAVIPIADMVLRNFINITNVIRHNPSNPRFYYYHFESIGALLRFATSKAASNFESQLFDPFMSILQNDVQEFMPYVFQLMAALLEANPSEKLPPNYQNLLHPLLTPLLWESKGNVPALVRLLSSMIQRSAEQMVQANFVEPTLGIFQNLISRKATETHGFDLLETVLFSFPAPALQSYFVELVRIMLNRLSNSRTENFSRRFVRFYHLISARDDRYGADFFIQVSDQVQHDVFKQLYLSVILPDTQKLPRPLDRKVAVVSLTKTLTDSDAFIQRYPKGWNITCEALLKLLINPPVPPAHDDIIVEQDPDDLSFGVGFTPLNTCRKPPHDPLPEVADVKSWVGNYLQQADVRHNGRIRMLMKDKLSPEAQKTLVAYMAS